VKRFRDRRRMSDVPLILSLAITFLPYQEGEIVQRRPGVIE
jgi:hypothetical protein